MVPVAQNQRSPPEGKGKGKGQKHKITYCKGKDLFLPGKEKRHLFIIFAVIFDFFYRKERLKRQKIAKSSICFEFQVVVAVVGFKWHRRGNAKNAD